MKIIFLQNVVKLHFWKIVISTIRESSGYATCCHFDENTIFIKFRKTRISGKMLKTRIFDKSVNLTPT